MPILRKGGRGVLFIHVPKTGGSSIENHFKAAGWKMAYHDGRVGAGTVNHYRWCTPQHMHAEALQQNFRLDRFDAVFMIVRHPIARFRSEYAWRHGIDGAEVDPTAEAVEAWARNMIETYRRRPHMLGNHIRPQAEFFVDGAEVFRFEDGLDHAVEVLNERYGLELPAGVGRARTSEGTSGMSSRDVEVSGATAGLLADFYRQDFERFAYTLEEQRHPAPMERAPQRVPASVSAPEPTMRNSAGSSTSTTNRALADVAQATRGLTARQLVAELARRARRRARGRAH